MCLLLKFKFKRSFNVSQTMTDIKYKTNALKTYLSLTLKLWWLKTKNRLYSSPNMVTYYSMLNVAWVWALKMQSRKKVVDCNGIYFTIDDKIFYLYGSYIRSFFLLCRTLKLKDVKKLILIWQNNWKTMNKLL